MADKYRDELLDHEYDGIREYDNPTPGWWHLIFWGTFIFSIGYFFFFQISSTSWTVVQAYEEDVADDLKLQFAEIGELEGNEATILKYMQEPKWLNVGASVFKTHCISCHAANGEGQIGPNLTDDHYKNIKDLTGLVRVINEGAANGAMPAWKTRLHPNEVVLTAAYVATMRGKNLPGPRGEEGEVIPPWPDAPAESTDSSTTTAPAASGG